MRLRIRPLETRVARRVLLLFLLSAAGPVATFAVLAYVQVRRQLTEQSWERLQATGKNLGMSLMERLLLIESEFARRSDASREIVAPASPNPRMFRRAGGGRFGAVPPAAGLERRYAALDSIRRERLTSGATVLLTAPGEESALFLIQQTQNDRDDSAYQWAEIDPDYLWVVAQGLPPGFDMCVVETGRLLTECSHAAVEAIAREAAKTGGAAVARLSWDDPDGKRLGVYREIFLGAEFGAPDWGILVSEAHAQVVAPVAAFTRTFVGVVLLCILIVALASDVQLARILGPVAKLKRGTEQVSRGDLAARVELSTGDEFEELSNSFNEMVQTLARQFRALRATSDIDGAILTGALETRSIVETVLRRAPRIVGASGMSLVVLDDHAGMEYWLESSGELGERALELCPEEIRRLVHLTTGELPGLIGPPGRTGREATLLAPIDLEDSIQGALCFVRPAGETFDFDDREHAGRLAAHVAVAISNTRLIRDLDELNLGTLRALASAIDAKSNWTAGHSERVTRLSMRIGRAMGLDHLELEILERGSILHDIGKIGVPAAILDKPGPLTPEERKIMQAHPEYGVRIVEPIQQYQPLLPIILQHHERMEGQGYPAGLSGSDIDLKARILGVADTFDAVTSDRPYRNSLPVEKAIAILTEKSGTAFDPRVVDAFMAIVREGTGIVASGADVRVAVG